MNKFREKLQDHEEDLTVDPVKLTLNKDQLPPKLVLTNSTNKDNLSYIGQNVCGYSNCLINTINNIPHELFLHI